MRREDLEPEPEYLQISLTSNILLELSLINSIRRSKNSFFVSRDFIFIYNIL